MLGEFLTSVRLTLGVRFFSARHDNQTLLLSLLSRLFVLSFSLSPSMLPFFPSSLRDQGRLAVETILPSTLLVRL